MLTRLTGRLESIADNRGVVEVAGGLAYEVMMPAYLAERLTPKIGQSVALTTFQYFESQGQGASFIPRLIGFGSVRDRDFFELFTTVKGIGNRKALRAMAVDPGAIAAAITAKDAKSLTKLPEIGKRLAETIIAELSGKVEIYLGEADLERLDEAAKGRAAMTANPAAEEAVAALIALGETLSEAERLVGRAIERAGRPVKTPDELLTLVYAGR